MLFCTTEGENNTECGDTEQDSDNLQREEQMQNVEQVHDHKNVEETVMMNFKRIKLQLIKLLKLVDSLMHPVCK